MGLMKILHCLRAPVGGLFRHVLDLALEQAKRGHEVGILADSNAEDRLTAQKFAAAAPFLKLGIIRTPISRAPGLGDLSAIRAVAAHAKRLDVDVLHGHGAKGGLYARLAALRLYRRGVRSFYTPHGGSLHSTPGSLAARVYMAVERGLEPLTDGVIFESAYAAEIYRARVGGRMAACRVIHNGVRDDDFEPVRCGADAADIIFVGELRDLKGVDVLIDAIAELKAERPIRASIVGSGPDADTLKARAVARGVDHLVVFTGALPIRDALTRGRIMAVPSRAESLPYVVLEAAAAGLPLVATSVGGIPEIVEGTDTALIAPGSVSALVEGLCALLDDPVTAEQRAGRLRVKVAQRFTVAAMTTDVLSFYGEAGSADSRAALANQSQLAPLRP